MDYYFAIRLGIDLGSDPVRIKSRGQAFYGLTDLMPILPSIGVAFDF